MTPLEKKLTNELTMARQFLRVYHDEWSGLYGRLGVKPVRGGLAHDIAKFLKRPIPQK